VPILRWIASRSREAKGIGALVRLGMPETHIIDRDKLSMPEDMPDPLTEEGRPNPAYGPGFMDPARALGRAVWAVFGPRVSPDFVVERPDQSTLHLSTFVVRDYDERDEMPSGWVVIKGNSNLSVLGSHMYRTGQSHEVTPRRYLGKAAQGVPERTDPEQHFLPLKPSRPLRAAQPSRHTLYERS
jgi:hypothetical protein